MSQVYADKNKVSGVNTDNPQEKQKIYEQYLQAFKKGAYNLIKEEQDPLSQQLTPRKYFSGGAGFTQKELNPAISYTHDHAINSMVRVPHWIGTPVLVPRPLIYSTGCTITRR